MKKIIILSLLVLLNIFSFSENFEKKENKKNGISSIELIIKENGDSYDFSLDFAINKGIPSSPKLQYVAGTAMKVGNKYVYTDDDSNITFDIQNKKVIISSNHFFSYAIDGSYNFIANSTDDDYKYLYELMEN